MMEKQTAYEGDNKKFTAKGVDYQMQDFIAEMRKDYGYLFKGSGGGGAQPPNNSGVPSGKQEVISKARFENSELTEEEYKKIGDGRAVVSEF